MTTSDDEIKATILKQLMDDLRSEVRSDSSHRIANGRVRRPLAADFIF